MLLFRLIIALFLFSIVPMALWGQTVVETVPAVDNGDHLFKSFFDKETFASILVGSIGFIIISSAIFYNYTIGRRQHPYRFLVQVIHDADKAVEDGRIEQACQICTQALQTINNDPILFPVKNKSRISATRMLKSKIQELKIQIGEQSKSLS